MLPQKRILFLFTDPGIIEPQVRRYRFWAKVDVGTPDECWLWTAATHELGYGVLGITASRFGPQYRLYAHRVAWVLTQERDIPEGYVIDHTCGNKACCNPAHLEGVTQTVNVDRYHALRPNAGTCKRGHAIERGKRCAECNRERVAAWVAAHPEARREHGHRHDLKRGKTGRGRPSKC